MELLRLALFHVLDFLHMGVGQDIVEAVRLAEYVLRNILQGSGRTHLHTLGFSVVRAQIAFQRDLEVGMNVHGSERTGPDAGFAADALFFLEVYHPVLSIEGTHRTSRHALGVMTLAADHGHAHNWMRIDSSNPYGGLLGVVHILSMNGTGDFTYPASRTAFRDNRQLFSHTLVLHMIIPVNRRREILC